MSLDMRLLTASDETAGSDSSEYLTHLAQTGDGPGQYSLVHQFSLGLPVLPAADSNYFARD